MNKFYTLEKFDSVCALRIFKINNIDANASDFCRQFDYSPHLNEKSEGCGNRVALIKKPKSEILKKYNITKEQYEIIAKHVSKELSFGKCNLCN